MAVTGQWYQADVRVPRLLALRGLLSRRGVRVTMRILSDGDFTAYVQASPRRRRPPAWHQPHDEWRTP